MHRIGAGHENNRDHRRGALSGKRRRRAEWRNDDSHVTLDQIRHQLWQPISVGVRMAVFDGYIATLDVAGFAQTFAECRQKNARRLSRIKVEISHHRHRRLLRPRRERPSSRRAAD